MPPTRLAVDGLVRAPPALVFEILSDYRRHHPRILPKPEFESLDVEEGGVGEGTLLRVGMKVMGARRVLRMRVDVPQPGRVLREREVPDGPVTTFTLTPEGGATRVEIATEWPEGRGLRGLVERLVNPRVVRPLYARELALLDAYAQELVQAPS